MAEDKDKMNILARAFKAIADAVTGKSEDVTKLAAQELKVKDAEPIQVDDSGAVTSGQADGDYMLEDGSTVTIADGKASEVKPGEQAPEATEGETEKAPEPGADEPKTADAPDPVKDLTDLVGQLLEEVKSLKAEKDTQLAAYDVKLADATQEIESLKRLPADNKMAPGTLRDEPKDLSKMSVADRAVAAIQGHK
jgi:hypothetical protein